MVDKMYRIKRDPEEIYVKGKTISGRRLAKDYLEVTDGDYPILQNLETAEDIDRAVKFVSWAWGLDLEECKPSTNTITEVRNDYNDGEGFTTIDVWENDEEEGRVVAVVHDSGDVYFIDNGLRFNEEIQTAINEVKERLKKSV